MEEPLDCVSINWKHHNLTLLKGIQGLRDREEYADVTLASGGKFFSVHKIVLSVSSDYFDSLIKLTSCAHPVIVLSGIDPFHLESLIVYMYNGSVELRQSDLFEFVRVAELLQIKSSWYDENDSSARNIKKSLNVKKTCPYRCFFCPSTSTLKMRFIHMKSHREYWEMKEGTLRFNDRNSKKLQCRFCSFVVSHPNAFKAHGRVHACSMDFNCFMCSYETDNKEKINMHLVSEEHLLKRREISIQIKNYDVEPKRASFKCSACPYTTENQLTFDEHIAHHFEGYKFICCAKCDFGTFIGDEMRNHRSMHLDE